MHTLTNWKAKRAGGRITVYGKDENGRDAKIVGVDTVEPAGGPFRKYVIARDKDGVEHRLKL